MTEVKVNMIVAYVYSMDMLMHTMCFVTLACINEDTYLIDEGHKMTGKKVFFFFLYLNLFYL